MKKNLTKLMTVLLSASAILPLANVSAQETVELDFAAIETAYGTEVWPQIIEAYNTVNPDVNITFTQEKELEDALTPRFQAQDYPDVVMLALSREKALPEALIKDKALASLTDVLDLTIPGEDVTVGEKLLEGFVDSTSTNPYNDGETYLMPMFYSPTGLFYNKALFEENGWEVPTTWDEMWVLSEEAAAQDIALFTYPTSGYLDTFFASIIYSAGGPELYAQAMNYDSAVWAGDQLSQVFATLGTLAENTESTTVANANPTDFTRNQQLILDNKALFMPNGTWVVGEMAEAPRADNFEWAMMAVPALEGGDSYAFTFLEHIWVPAGAENQEAAKDFIAFLYSDVAAEIFAEHGAVQPIKGLTEKLSEEQQVFYSIYDNGVLPGMGGFVSAEAIPGVDLPGTLYGQFDGVAAGDVSVEDWQASVVEVMEQLSQVIIE